MSNVQGPPDEIQPGQISFTFSYDQDGEEATSFDFRATWDEGWTMTWWQDISEHQGGLSPGSSAPSEGWASWRNSKDLLIAYTWFDASEDGWVYVRGGAPTNEKDDPEGAMYEPDTWIELARTILAAVHGNLPDAERKTYE
jgi:hypothetical protein